MIYSSAKHHSWTGYETTLLSCTIFSFLLFLPPLLFPFAVGGLWGWCPKIIFLIIHQPAPHENRSFCFLRRTCLSVRLVPWWLTPADPNRCSTANSADSFRRFLSNARFPMVPNLPLKWLLPSHRAHGPAIGSFLYLRDQSLFVSPAS